MGNAIWTAITVRPTSASFRVAFAALETWSHSSRKGRLLPALNSDPSWGPQFLESPPESDCLRGVYRLHGLFGNVEGITRHSQERCLIEC